MSAPEEKMRRKKIIMDEKIKVVINNEQKTVKIPAGIRMLIRRCCHAVLMEEKFEKPAEVDVLFVDNERIREINKQHRDIDKETDVLSFPMGVINEDGTDTFELNPETKCYLLGDIVISVEKAKEQAEQFHHSFDREMAFLTVHSMFHIMGYDHEKSNLDTLIMREKEEKVLQMIGLPGSNGYFDDEN